MKIFYRIFIFIFRDTKIEKIFETVKYNFQGCGKAAAPPLPFPFFSLSLHFGSPGNEG
jgi:hypothetical protein